MWQDLGKKPKIFSIVSIIIMYSSNIDHTNGCVNKVRVDIKQWGTTLVKIYLKEFPTNVVFNKLVQMQTVIAH